MCVRVCENKACPSDTIVSKMYVTVSNIGRNKIVCLHVARPAAFDINNNNNIEMFRRPSEKDAYKIVYTHYVYRL